MAQTAKSVRGDGDSSDNNGSSGLITSRKEIMELYEALVEVTKGEEICLGSVIKIDKDSYENWGIGITDENEDMLRRESAEIYKKDYVERRKNHEIDGLLKTEHKDQINRSMEVHIAVSTREMLGSLDDGKRSFNVCTIPARDGRLAAAIAGALYRSDAKTRSILARTTFHLVELSGTKLDRAEEKLGHFKAKVHTHMENDDELLDVLPSGIFDIVASVAHFHHKSFLVDYLKKLRNVLADNGALLIGDWHSPLCSHPANVANLFQNLGLPHRRQEMFRNIMGELLEKNRKLNSKEEMEAMMAHILHWKRISHNLSQESILPKPRLYILGAHDTSRQREEKLDSADFDIDADKVRKAFKGAKLPGLPKQGKGGKAKKGFLERSDGAIAMTAIKKKR